jgi:ABC-2 type transport system permease protein
MESKLTTTPTSTQMAGHDKQNAPASPLRQIGNQTYYELLLTSRRGENVLVTLIIPVVLLAFFSSLNIMPQTGNNGPAGFLLPGILAIAIIAAGMVNLGIATAYERYYGVLKRLGSSPLSRSSLIAAKIVSILALEIVQMILLIAIAAIFFHWHMLGSAPLTLLIIVLGTITFSALGLAMAGALRAEMTLAGANALFLVFLMLGGGILPLSHLPGPLASLAQILPSTALTQALQQSMNGTTFPTQALVVLLVWTVIILLVTMRTFKWE